MCLTYISTGQNLTKINGAGVDGFSAVNINNGNVTTGGGYSDSFGYTGTVLQVSNGHNWTVLKDCHGKYNGTEVAWKAGYSWHDSGFPTVVLVAD